MHSLKKYLSILVMVGIFLTACTTEECLENRSALPLAGFYNASDKRNISFGGLYIYGIGAPGDTMISDGSTIISDTYLPFRIDAESTTYVFRHFSSLPTEQQISDTVTFNYSAQPFFVSVACGVSYRFEMTSIDYTRHAIDSVACPGGVITNIPTENLQIFFKTDEQGGDNT